MLINKGPPGPLGGPGGLGGPGNTKPGPPGPPGPPGLYKHLDYFAKETLLLIVLYFIYNYRTNRYVK